MRYLLNGAVIIAALGYFVDIYDLILFSIVRKASLTELGVMNEAQFDTGTYLNNMQMFGMLLGGLVWGILGDKKGRLSVLFGSIFLYSIANILNGFVQNVQTYAILRFIAGIGLAGELGAGITLVAEILPKEKRGYGTMIVATVGLSGAILAGIIAQIFSWRTCYFIGGGLGLALLFLRISVTESGMFHKKTAEAHIKRGDFLSLFANSERLKRYLRCIFVGLPTWFVVGILVAFADKFAEALGVDTSKQPVIIANAVMATYTGLVIGDILTGLLSQYWKSRKKVMSLFLGFNLIAIFIYLNAFHVSVNTIYLLCGLLGLSVGFWVIFVTIAAEQFGTNLRATVTTTVPNFIRGSLIPLTFLFQYVKGQTDLLTAGMIIGVFSLIVAFICLYGMKETFDADLDYHES